MGDVGVPAPHSGEMSQLVGHLLVPSPWLPHRMSWGHPALPQQCSYVPEAKGSHACSRPSLGAGFFQQFLRDLLTDKANCPQQAHWAIPRR